jgi:hypothetical protein
MSNPFQWLAESTWGYPIAGAIHVLGLAWFGGAALFEVSPGFKRFGLALMLSTGALLFAMQPHRYYDNAAFILKLLLLVAVGFYPRLVLWAAVIFASRAIAFM